MGQKRLTAAHRRKLSEAAKARHLRNLELKVAEPDRKHCAKCKRWLPVESFYVRRKKVKSGVVSERPESWCKKCTSDTQKARYERQKAEGLDFKARRKGYEAKGDTEARRARRREQETTRRRRLGMKVRTTWVQHPREGDFLDVEPLALFLEKELEVRNGPAISAAAGVHERKLTSILRRESKVIGLGTIDKFLSGLGVPHELPRLYPEA